MNRMTQKTRRNQRVCHRLSESKLQQQGEQNMVVLSHCTNQGSRVATLREHTAHDVTLT